MADQDWSRGAEVSDPGRWQWHPTEPWGSDEDWWGTNQHNSQQQWQDSSWGYSPWQWWPSSWGHGWYYDSWQQGRWNHGDSWRTWSWDDENYERSANDGTLEDQKDAGEDAIEDDERWEAPSRRQSKQTDATRATASDDMKSHDDEEDSQDPSMKGVRTGKDYIPEFDGKTPMRDYERRVRLFEANTSIHPTYRAGKLIERLKDQAWKATEMIDIMSLKVHDGVDRLLRHLWEELEPLEFLRTFATLGEFYKGFRRTSGQQFTEYDMEFRRQCMRLDEINAGIYGVARAYWFLEKAGLSPELRKQVVAAAGGCYDYPKLRAALVAIVPNVQREENKANPPTKQLPFRNKKTMSHKVNVVEGELGDENRRSRRGRAIR